MLVVPDFALPFGVLYVALAILVAQEQNQKLLHVMLSVRRNLFVLCKRGFLNFIVGVLWTHVSKNRSGLSL